MGESPEHHPLHEFIDSAAAAHRRVWFRLQEWKKRKRCEDEKGALDIGRGCYKRGDFRADEDGGLANHSG